MTFMPRMTAETRAIRTLRPLSWRRWPGVIADVWHVHGEAGGGGFYSAPDPRLVVFLGGGGESLRLRTSEAEPWRDGVGVFYIPAHVPLWSELGRAGAYAHLDLHLDAGPLAQRLQGLAAPRDLATPRLIASAPRIEALAAMIADEVQHPGRPDLATDGLLSALLAEVIDLPAPSDTPAPDADRGGVPPRILRRLEAHAREALGRRIPTAELAELAGLSESWLTRGFRQSLGQTPQRWLMGLRLDAAQALMPDAGRSLADIAAATGFADQAHLSRAFRARHGQSPGDWRRQRFVPDPSNSAGSVQATRQIPR